MPRATTSAVPPAVKGMMMRSGLLGQVSRNIRRYRDTNLSVQYGKSGLWSVVGTLDQNDLSYSLPSVRTQNNAEQSSQSVRVYYSPSDLLARGAIGEPTAIECHRGHRGPTHASWFYDRALAGGGVLADLGIYHLTTVASLFGPARMDGALAAYKQATEKRQQALGSGEECLGTTCAHKDASTLSEDAAPCAAC